MGTGDIKILVLNGGGPCKRTVMPDGTEVYTCQPAKGGAKTRTKTKAGTKPMSRLRLRERPPASRLRSSVASASGSPFSAS